MNKSLTTLCILMSLSFVSQAKELPAMSDMMDNLNKSGLTGNDKWEQMGDGFKQDVESGMIFVAPESISSMMVVQGGNQKEVLDSFTYANIHCASSSLVAIDMMQNTTILNDLMETFSSSIEAYENKANTLAWGYKYEAKLVKATDGIIATCSLKP